MRLDVRWFPTVTSTMDVAAEAADAGAGEGLVIVAEEQTAGRGRRGRPWSSPAGSGLYVSFVFRPPAEALSAPLLAPLTLAAGVAVRRAIIGATGLTPELKWPNDVVVGRRKLAGILAEGVGIGTAAQTVILGVGINVSGASHPGEIAQRATSLEAELGHAIEREPVLEELLIQIPAAYDQLRRGDADDILRSWRQASASAVGSAVEWTAVEGVRRGTTAGIDDDGALLVRTAGGTERVVAGEVRWL
jgi:BirA family biotin operon repressor/biotin-[acetyl-CoA-carboxylase] ligase